jgi:hypothetical protein
LLELLVGFQQHEIERQRHVFSPLEVSSALLGTQEIDRSAPRQAAECSNATEWATTLRTVLGYSAA